MAFYRGAAAVMAADLVKTPASGLRVQACGDCHLMNFGGFATPTEAGSVGAVGATVLAALRWRLSFKVFRDAAMATAIALFERWTRTSPEQRR